MECKVCPSKKFQTYSVTEFKSHYLLLHNATPKSVLLCGFKDCYAIFKDPHRYNQHVLECHDEVNKSQSGTNSVGVKTPASNSFLVHECQYPNCDYVARSKTGLRNHVFWKHKGDTQRDCRSDTGSGNRSPTSMQTCSEALVPTEAESVEVTDTPENSQLATMNESGNVDFLNIKDHEQLLLKKFAQTFMTLNSKYHVPDSTLSFVLESYRFLIQESTALTKSSIMEKLRGINNVPSDVFDIISSELSSNPLASFHSVDGPMRSSYIRQQKYENFFRYVPPKSHFLGLNQNNEPRKCHYVSIKETIQNLFEDDSVYEEYLERQGKDFHSTDHLIDIQSGLAFQKNEFFKSNPTAIQIILHQDDAELANALGAAKGTYKMTFYNYTLGNIHPWSRSRTDAQQLALVCAEKDVAYFGVEKVISPILKELRDLETDGIKIRDRTVKASILVVLGDNLGTHMLGGFVENFSTSLYFCRYCEESRQEWLARWHLETPDLLSGVNDSSEESDSCWEDSESEHDDSSSGTLSDPDSIVDLRAELGGSDNESDDDMPLSAVRDMLTKFKKRRAPIRTKMSYEACVAALANNPNGVKGIVANCQLHILEHFHVILGTPPCLPHDTLLGFIPYDLVLVLKKLSVDFNFSFESISRRVKKFKFLDGDASDKPPAKFSVGMKKLSGHAVQNWTFLRFLPLLIGDKILDKSSPVWKMVLTLIEAMQLLCSPVISKKSISYIDNLISQYLQLRTTLFQVKLRPKHHYFEHYAWLTEVYGPLMRCSTLGFERKNKFYRETIRSKKNLKNPTKLLSSEHQRMQSALLGDRLFESGPSFEGATSFDAINVSESISRCIVEKFGKEIAASLLFSREAKFRSTMYKSKRFIVTSTHRYPELSGCKIELLFSHGKILFAVECSSGRSKSAKEPAILQVDRIFSDTFRKTLQGPDRLSKFQRLKLVRDVGDEVAEKALPIRFETCLKVSNFLMKKYPKALSAVDQKEGIQDLAHQIMTRAHYYQRKRKRSRPTDSSDEVFQKFSKRENFGIDTERDLPTDLPIHETTESQKKKKLDMQLMASSGVVDWALVERLMKETYVSQRVTVNSKVNMEELLQEWPFFGRPKILRAHFYTLMSISEQEVTSRLNDACPKLMKFFRSKAERVALKPDSQKAQNLVNILKAFNKETATCALELATITLCLATEMRQNLKNLFIYFDADTSFDEIQASKALPDHGKPIIAVLGPNLMCEPRCFIVVEKRCTSTFTVKAHQAIQMVLMYYFILKITYPKDLAALLEFFQRYIFKISGSEAESKISRVERKKLARFWETAPPPVSPKYLHFVREFEDYCAQWSL